MQLSYKTYEHSFSCPELRVTEYKDLLKSILGDDVNPTQFVTYFIELFSNLSKKPIEFFESLTMLDLFLLLLQLRVHTLGNTSHLILKPKEDQAKDINLHLNLQRVIEELSFDIQPIVVELDEISLTIWFPHLKAADKNNVISHIKSCSVKNTKIDIIDFKTAEEIYKRLPAQVAIKLQKAVNDLYETLFAINFLSPYEGCDEHSLGFDLQIETLLWYCKLLFNEPLDVFLDNMFYLTYYGHFNTDYLERSCAPGEYIYYTKKLQQELTSKSRENTDTSSHHGAGLNEFGDM